MDYSVRIRVKDRYRVRIRVKDRYSIGSKVDIRTPDSMGCYQGVIVVGACVVLRIELVYCGMFERGFPGHKWVGVDT